MQSAGAGRRPTQVHDSMHVHTPPACTRSRLAAGSRVLKKRTGGRRGRAWESGAGGSVYYYSLSLSGPIC